MVSRTAVLFAQAAEFPPASSEEWRGLTTSALWLALIFALLAGVLKFAREYRRGGLKFLEVFTGRDANTTEDAHQTLTKFRELHERGGLSDAEYRTIKAKLAPELSPDGGATARAPTTDDSPKPSDNLALAESLKAAMADAEGAGGASE